MMLICASPILVTTPSRTTSECRCSWFAPIALTVTCTVTSHQCLRVPCTCSRREGTHSAAVSDALRQGDRCDVRSGTSEIARCFLPRRVPRPRLGRETSPSGHHNAIVEDRSRRDSVGTETMSGEGQQTCVGPSPLKGSCHVPQSSATLFSGRGWKSMHKLCRVSICELFCKIRTGVMQ